MGFVLKANKSLERTVMHKVPETKHRRAAAQLER